MKIKDKVVIITGASSGIGKKTAQLLAKHQAKVVLGARRENCLADISRQIKDNGGEVSYKKTDVTNFSSVKNLIDFAKNKYQRIDVLFNGAGLFPFSFLSDLKVHQWDKMIDTNIKGVLYGIAAVLPIMKKQKTGHIITISSVAAHIVFPSGVLYAATKSAVSAIMEGLRKEQVSNNIKTTLISPGRVNTKGAHINNQDLKDKEIGKSYSNILSPLDIAKAVLYTLEQPKDVSINEILIRPKHFTI